MAESTAAESRVAQQLVEAFAAFGPLYMRWVEGRVRPTEVSFTRMRLLWAVHCGGPQMMSGLRQTLGVTPANVTALVDALEGEGLVRRRPHPTDRRATLIELTPAGETTCRQTYAHQRDDVAALFAALSVEDQQTLLRLITQLTAVLRQ